jgi:hypothetical protein
MHGSADPDPHQNVMDPEHCNLAGQSPLSSALASHIVLNFKF